MKIPTFSPEKIASRYDSVFNGFPMLEASIKESDKIVEHVRPKGSRLISILKWKMRFVIKNHTI